MHHIPRLRLLYLCGLCASAALTLAPSPALAYRQTKLCVYPEERSPEAPTRIPDCDPGETPWLVAWPERTIPFAVHRGGYAPLNAGEQVIQDDLLAALRASLEQWTAPPCSDFVFRYDGLTDTSRHAPEDGTNVITFVDSDWTTTSTAIAITFTTTNQRGELIDADIELNAANNTFVLEPMSGQGASDVRNTVTHEAGHVLGLDHSAVPEATMQFNAPDNEIRKRDLHPDDIAGLCAIYPLGAPPRLYPRPEDEERGCCAQLPSSPSLPTPLALALGVAWMWRRRSSRT